jgi:hypothetical protein
VGRSHFGFLFTKESILMKDPLDVLRFKEEELSRTRKEVEALRLAVELLNDEGQSAEDQALTFRRVVDLP